MARWIRPTTRHKIYDRDNRTCFYCLRQENELTGKNALSLDHIIPRSVYRTQGLPIDNRASNLITCCRNCNSKRRDTPLKKWCVKIQNKNRNAGQIISEIVVQLNLSI